MEGYKRDFNGNAYEPEIWDEDDKIFRDFDYEKPSPKLRKNKEGRTQSSLVYDMLRATQARESERELSEAVARFNAYSSCIARKVHNEV